MNPYDLLHRAQQTPGLTQTQKGVLIALLTFADANGWAWPSIDTIAEYASLKERSVQNAIAQLVACGIVDRHDRAGATCRYQVRFDRLAERREGCTKSTPARRAPPHEKHPRMKDTPARRAPLLPKNEAGGVHDERGGVHLVHRGGAFGAPEVAIEDTNEDTITPPTPSFDSTVADPAVNEEEEDNFQQNPEDSCTQQPKSMIEPEQTMDPNDYNHDEDIDAEIAAFLEEQKRIAKQNEQGTGVEPAKDSLENVGRYLTDPDYAPSLWKNLADRMPKEKVRDIVPLEQLPPDPELDAMLAEQWKSRVTDDTIGPLPSVRDTMREIAQGTAQTTPPPAAVARPVAPVAPQGANLPRWLRQGPKAAVAPAPVAVKPQLPKVPGELMVLFTSPTKEGEMGMTPSDAQRLIVALVQNEIRTSDVLFSRSRSELKMMRGVSAYNERIEAYLQRAHGIGLAPDYRNRWDVIVSSLARHDDMNHLSDNERSAIGAMGLTWPRMKAMSTFELSRKAESFVDEMRLLPRVQTYGDMYNK